MNKEILEYVKSTNPTIKKLQQKFNIADIRIFIAENEKFFNFKENNIYTVEDYDFWENPEELSSSECEANYFNMELSLSSKGESLLNEFYDSDNARRENERKEKSQKIFNAKLTLLGVFVGFALSLFAEPVRDFFSWLYETIIQNLS